MRGLDGLSTCMSMSALLNASWESAVAGGGHYAPVADLSWEPSGGHYLISVSKDQTARVWGQWTEGLHARRRMLAAAAALPRGASGASSRAPALAPAPAPAYSFAEIARPQVHGFDLKCVALLGSRRHCYVSGADDEKVLRVLYAPSTFVDTLRHLSGDAAVHDEMHASHRSDFASLPALGLSNKPMASSLPAASQAALPEGATPAAAREEDGGGGDGEEVGMGGREEAGGQQEQQVVATPKALVALPTEEELLQHTLWPEIAKL